MGLDSRIGPKFLSAGPGFGGSCFPKDTRAIAQIFREQGMHFRIIEAVLEGNGQGKGRLAPKDEDARREPRTVGGQGMPFRISEAVLEANEQVQARMITKIENALGQLGGKTVGVLGLSFKPNTDDIRESPAIPIVEGLLERGATVRAFDPEAMTCFKPLYPAVHYCDNAYEVAEGADALVIVTEWNQFRKLELDRLRQLLNSPMIIDLRNLYEPEKMVAAGFDYISIGRPAAHPTAGDHVDAIPGAQARPARARR